MFNATKIKNFYLADTSYPTKGVGMA